MKKILIILFVATFSMISIAQTEIEKIKTKNFIGTWYSNEKLADVKANPLLTFYKNSTANIKDTPATTFKISNDDIYIYRKADAKIDTLRVLWFYVKESKNLKVTEKVNTGQKVPITKTDDYGKTVSTSQDIYINKTSTYHVESMTEEKMVLKYVN